MKDPLAVKRYGDAFWSYAQETMGAENCLQNLKNLRAIIRENPEFLQILESPEITFSEKSDFIQKVLNEDFCEEIRHFLKLLLEKERIEKLCDILEYLRVTYGHEGETEALLKTAYPLDLELIRSIKDRLENKFHKKFKFYIDLDGSLLGGVQVIIGNTIIDGSVRGRLDDLKEKLKSVRVD